MSMRNLVLIAAATLSVPVLAQEGPGLGGEVAAEDISAWDISIAPDGAGLPAGSGTATQGEPVYAAQCLVCHGPGGAGLGNDVLVGGHGTLDGAAPAKTIGSFWPYATTVFDYIRRAMPYLTPESLTSDEVYAVTAYLLHLNGIIDEDEIMDAQTLPEVQMPNRENFTLAYPAASAD